MGLKYKLPQKSKEDEMKSTKVSSNTTSSNSEVAKAIERGKGGKVPVKTEVPVKAEDESRSGGLVWVDVWLWRMIPNGEDNRTKWRRQFDNGEIKYKYDYQNSDEGVTFFGISVKWKVIEILCADVRVPELAVHHQRIDEMDKMSIDDYTTIAFQRMTSWFPQFGQGIELNKFMKMIKETKIFPDIKKPARIGQLEQLFQQELKTEDSIIDKYVNYAAFCRLLQEVALIRYPPGQKLNTDENASIVSTEEASDMISLASELSGSNSSVSNSKISKSKPRNEKEEKRAKKLAEAATANNIRVFVSPEEAAAAYRNLVTDFLLNIPEWSAHVWQQAKLSAMKKESRLYAAATKIMTVFRGKRIKRYYLQLKRAIVTLQAHARRKSTARKIFKIKKMLFEDWLFRRRYQAATLFVALVRRFLARTRKTKIYKRLNEQQVKVSKANRKRKAKMNAKDRQSVLFKIMSRISGMSLLVCVKRKDQRSYSKDYSMVIEVYLPLTQETFKFVIEEDELRGFMQAETGLSVLSAEQILNKGNIQKVLNARLMVKVSNKPGIKPRVMFSRQALGQRGMKCMTKGKMIGNDMFICSLYQSAADISIQCYHRLTCKVFTANISMDMLKEWIAFDHRQNCKSELELYSTPYLLQPDNVATLHYWLICNLIADTRHRKFAIIFACQLERSKKLAAIVTIQSIWRRALVRQHCPGWVDKYIIIVKSSPAHDASCYYLNLNTGESFWEKPKLLRGNELPTQPVHRWIEVNYYIEGHYQKYFVNPYNGVFTQKSLDRAAQIIQAVARKRRLNMHSLSVEAFNRAVKFEGAAEVVYKSQKKKLSTVINFALVRHAISLDLEGARKLYEEAMSLSDTNPLVLRSYAIFKICFLEAPVQPNYERALVLLKDAKVRDPQALQFMTAYEIVFKYGCYRNPNNCMSYLNLGLAAYYVLGDMKTAEKCCRRAVAMNPFDERVLFNWKMLRDKFPDKLLAIQPRSRIEQNNTSVTNKKRIIDGKQYDENPAWAGWLFFEVPPVENEDFIQQEESYWFNPATGEQRLKTPDWASEWYVRATRSRWDGSRDGLEHYFDPLTSSYFQYHALTDSYQ
jgi:tetratricopeptide (TPR) repeat protein